MSSITGISSSGVDLTQLLRQLKAAQEENQESRAQKSGGPMGGAPPADFESKFGSALKAAGVSDDEVTEIQEEIKSAIAAATQDQDGSEGNREAVKSAIDGVLEDHGLDSQAVQEQFRSLAGPPPGGPPPGGPPQGAAGAADSSSTSSSDSATLESMIQQLLASGSLDSTTAQLLQGMLPSVDTTV